MLYCTDQHFEMIIFVSCIILPYLHKEKVQAFLTVIEVWKLDNQSMMS
jgi:hypothetical protein